MNEFIRHWLYPLAILFAAISIPLSKFSTLILNMDFEKGAWWSKLFSYVLGFALLGLLLIPTILVKESNKGEIQGGALLATICWTIYMLQLFYRMGVEAGKQAKDK